MNKGKYELGVIHDAYKEDKSRHIVLVNYKYNEKFCKALGLQIRKVRLKQGLSMRQLGLQADMEYSQLSKIERGVTNPTVSTLQALAEALEISIKDFFDFEYPQKPFKD